MTDDQIPVPEPLDEAIDAFLRMSVPQRPSDTDLLARLGARQGGMTRPASSPFPSTRRGSLIRFVVPSAAAALLVIGLVGLLLLNSAPSIALADVVQAAQKHKLVRYREQQITDTNEPIGAGRDSVVHADLTAPRLRSENRFVYPGGEAVHLSVHDGRRHLTTDSRQKTATLDFAPKGYKSLLCCLEEFQQKKGLIQGTDTLDGLAMVRYHLEEDKQTTTLWVDAKTKLPIRLDQVFFDPAAEGRRTRLVWTDFAWDPQVPEGFRSLDELFSTQPPDGYTLHDRTKEKKENGRPHPKN